MVMRRTGTTRGMNAALLADTSTRAPLPHTSRRQLAISLVLTVAVIVAAVLIVRHFLSGDRSYPGVVVQSQEARINFASSGRITAVQVHPGQLVHAGEVLARQDDRGAAATLAAAQAVLAQAKTKLAFLQAPSLSAAQARQAELVINQAQSVLAGDQVAATDAQNAVTTAQASTASAVSAATTALAGAQAQFESACPHGVGAPPPAGAPAGTVSLYLNCQNLADTLSKAQVALTAAQATQTTTVQAAHQASDQAAATVNNDRAALAAAQNQASAQTAALSSPTALTDATAAVAQAQVQVSTAQATLIQLTITAPSDGVVADVYGVVGEVADSGGVHNYPGPQSETPQKVPTYTLFPASGVPNGYTSSTVASYPMLTFYPAAGMRVVAEVPESDISKLTPGSKVKITVTALSTTVDGVVDYVIPEPIRATSGVSYQCLISSSQLSAGVIPGMSTSVTR